MTKKIKLLKDLPKNGLKAGAIGEFIKGLGEYVIAGGSQPWYVTEEEVKDFPDWYGVIWYEVVTNRFRPWQEQPYYYLDGDLKIWGTFWHDGDTFCEMRFRSGNVFETAKQAKEAKREFKKTLLKLHKKWAKEND